MKKIVDSKELQDLKNHLFKTEKITPEELEKTIKLIRLIFKEKNSIIDIRDDFKKILLKTPKYVLKHRLDIKCGALHRLILNYNKIIEKLLKDVIYADKDCNLYFTGE